MPFIGNQPALSYTSFAKQDFTTSATTSYTLDNPVANENEIALFINFVRQEPTTAYTASGTSLTLTSATSASDDMYCVFLGKAVQTVNPPSGSVGLSQLSATGTKDATTFLRGDNTFASAGGANTPIFVATLSADQSISNSTITKINFNSEEIDTDSAFDSSTNYRFTVPSGQAGKYLINGAVRLESFSNANLELFLYKNGSEIYRRRTYNDAYNHVRLTQILSLAESDYLELYLLQDTGGSASVTGGTGDPSRTMFQGFKLVE